MAPFQEARAPAHTREKIFRPLFRRVACLKKIPTPDSPLDIARKKIPTSDAGASAREKNTCWGGGGHRWRIAWAHEASRALHAIASAVLHWLSGVGIRGPSQQTCLGRSGRFILLGLGMEMEGLFDGNPAEVIAGEGLATGNWGEFAMGEGLSAWGW